MGRIKGIKIALAEKGTKETGNSQNQKSHFRTFTESAITKQDFSAGEKKIRLEKKAGANKKAPPGAILEELSIKLSY